MKTNTTTNYVTKLIVVKPFTYAHPGGKTTLKAGRVLETIKHKNNHYYPWIHKIVMGHGLAELVPLEYVKVKWFKETKTVTVKTEEIKVK